MVLLMRYAGLRVSDVVTLSRDHIKGIHLEKRAVKNHRHDPRGTSPGRSQGPRAAAPSEGSRERFRLFFSGGNASLRSLVKGAQRLLAAVFKRAKVDGGHPHRFRHTLASELLGKGAKIEDIAGSLADSPATVRRHYAKWTARTAGPSGPGNSVGSRHKSGTRGRTGQLMLILRGLGWWPGTESNRRRQPFQGCALPAELPGRESISLPASSGPPQMPVLSHTR